MGIVKEREKDRQIDVQADWYLNKMADKQISLLSLY